MPSSTISWSTKHANDEMNNNNSKNDNNNASKTTTMNSPSKFRTPPMVRSFDGNNNGKSKLFVSDGVTIRHKSRREMLAGVSGGLHGSGTDEGTPFRKSPSSHQFIVDMPCDDCGLRAVGQDQLILRWCEDCNEAICDACVLDKHTVHSVCWYKEALNSANRKLRDVLDVCIEESKQLRSVRVKSQKFANEVSTKIRDTKQKVRRRADESKTMIDQLVVHYNDLHRLTGVVVNSKTVAERRHSANVALAVIDVYARRQSVIDKQLGRIEEHVTKSIDAIVGPKVNDDIMLDEDGKEEIAGGDY